MSLDPSWRRGSAPIRVPCNLQGQSARARKTSETGSPLSSPGSGGSSTCVSGPGGGGARTRRRLLPAGPSPRRVVPGPFKRGGASAWGRGRCAVCSPAASTRHVRERGGSGSSVARARKRRRWRRRTAEEGTASGVSGGASAPARPAPGLPAAPDGPAPCPGASAGHC